MLRESTAAVKAAAVADGQDVAHAAIYPNGALFGTPLEDIYGGNVPRLKQIRKKVDPKDVMGLAVEFKFDFCDGNRGDQDGIDIRMRGRPGAQKDTYQFQRW